MRKNIMFVFAYFYFYFRNKVEAICAANKYSTVS